MFEGRLDKMPASAINEPAVVPQNEEEQIAELRRIVQEGTAKLLGPEGRQLALPATVQELLLHILRSLQAGKAVSIVVEHQELTTQRAANLLGVSRPFLVRLLEEGHMPFHMVGSHRRIYLRDLLAYKHRRDNARHEALDQLAKVELEAGTYDKVFLPEGAEEE
jgi:excisionase family DNA binding protein